MTCELITVAYFFNKAIRLLNNDAKTKTRVKAADTNNTPPLSTNL